MLTRTKNLPPPFVLPPAQLHPLPNNRQLQVFPWLSLGTEPWVLVN